MAEAPPKKNPNEFQIEVAKDGPSREELIAKIAVQGDLANAGTTITFAQGHLGTGDITQAIDSLRGDIAAVKMGQMQIADHLLVGQAVALNSIFNELMRRAAMNMNEYPKSCEIYMRLGLKAQSQCRATLESLAEIKNPRQVAFVRQANIAHGHQQVNNGTATGAGGKDENQQNEILESSDEQRLVGGTQASAVGGYSPMEAVVEGDWTKVRCRQGTGGP